jgi:hypothetical protein
MSYIEREPLLRLAEEKVGEPFGAPCIAKAIKEAPEVDVVAVVRCKDCKFNVANMQIDENDGTDYSGEDIVCSYFMTDGLEPNDYCSYGERREE